MAAATFTQRLKDLVAFDAATHEFHCPADRAAFEAVQYAAAEFLADETPHKGAVMKAKLDYANSLFTGTVCVEAKPTSARTTTGHSRSSDPERHVTPVRCVHYDKVVKKDGRKFVRDAKGNKTYTLVRCTEVLEGTAAQMAEWKSLCPAHR